MLTQIGAGLMLAGFLVVLYSTVRKRLVFEDVLPMTDDRRRALIVADRQQRIGLGQEIA